MNLQESGWRFELDWSGSGQAQVAGSCKSEKKKKKHSSSKKYNEFLDCSRNHHLLKKK